MKMSRAERNNNPGNIKQNNQLFKGEVRPSGDSVFKRFTDMTYGFRAIISVLKTYFYKWGLKTLAAIIRRWAPETENKTAQYLKFVCERTGLQPTDILKFSLSVFGAIILAIAHYESGYEKEEWQKNITDAWNEKFKGFLQ